jgi:cell division FtsZ-interacting protein ZapD
MALRHLMYPDNQPFDYGRFSVTKLYPTSCWKKHLDNYFYLRFLFEHSDDRSERLVANKEMQIAEKKMKYWERMPDFDKEEADAYLQKLKKTWNLSNNNSEFVLDKHYRPK